MTRGSLALLLMCAAAVPGARAAAISGKPLSPQALGQKAVETVAAHVKSRDSEVRAKAAEVLGQAGNKAAAGVLAGMLGDRDKYVRIAAARSLWELGLSTGLKTVYAIINDVPARGTVINSPLVELKMISQNKIREHALEALVYMRRENAADILYKLKNDDYGAIRDAAARELARLGHSEELEQFTGALSSEDEAVRYQSATALAGICAAGAVRRLAELLATETTVRVRVAALEALGCSPEKKNASVQLLKLADDANSTIRFKAVSALGGIKDDKVKAKFEAIAAGTEDMRLKIAAQRGLALSGGKAEISAARSGLNAISPEVRLEALGLLENFSPEESLPLLAQALEDEDPQVKLAAALQTIKRFSLK